MEQIDSRIAALLKKYPCYELDFRLDDYMDSDDYEELGQLDYIRREIDWIVEDFEDCSHALGQSLEEALELKKTSKNFKQLPSLKTNDLYDEIRHSEIEFNDAKSLIKDYKNALKLQKELSVL